MLQVTAGRFGALAVSCLIFSVTRSFALAPQRRFCTSTSTTTTTNLAPLDAADSDIPKNDMMKLSKADNKNVSSVASRTLRVLALHGSGGTAADFPCRLEALSRRLAQHHDIKVALTAVQAPFDKDQGFSWWTMPPGVRSFNADTYTGFETSATKVLDVWSKGEDGSSFDLVLGHSQGAILVASLLALQRVPYHPRLGYLMNGVSLPNPYKVQLEALRVNVGNYNNNDEDEDDDEDDDSTKTIPPRALFLLGTNDQVTPNETGEQLRDAMQQSGIQVKSIYHPGGHAVPDDDETVEKICQWITESL